MFILELPPLEILFIIGLTILSFVMGIIVHYLIRSNKNDKDEIEAYRRSQSSNVDDQSEEDNDDDYLYIAHSITIYGIDGKIIQQFQGTLKVIDEHTDNGYIYFDDGTLQHSIVSIGTIIVDFP